MQRFQKIASPLMHPGAFTNRGIFHKLCCQRRQVYRRWATAVPLPTQGFTPGC